jgi:predicted extracellular nuclease
MNSKGGDGPLYGDIQPAPLNSEAQRMGQAKLINEFVEEILRVDSQAYVVVMGDLNDFPWSAPIQQLCGNELVNLIQGLEPGEWYTYIYEGNGQVLDQILVSQALSEKLSYFDIVHVNAEQLSEDRLSDHDPLLAVFSLE